MALIAGQDMFAIGDKVFEQIDRMKTLDKFGAETDNARFFLTVDDEVYTVVVSKGRHDTPN